MQVVFPRINNAIRFTLEYYQISKISDNMLRMAGNGWQATNPKTFIDWYNLVISMHDNMENEILQVINTSNHITLVTMFEYLKACINDDRLKDGVNYLLLYLTVNEYNTRVYKDFLERTEKKVKEFHEKRDKSLGHLEEIKIKPITYNLPLSVFLSKNPKKNYIYYCIEEIPELLDITYLTKYADWVNDLIQNFKYKVERHIKLFDEGKYIAFDIIKVAQIQISNSPQVNYPLLENQKIENLKLKVNITVEQLAFLFRLLKESKIIDSRMDKEIHLFIADNFETKGSEGKKISAKNVGKLFSTKDSKIINFWIATFKEMIEKASKK